MAKSQDNSDRWSAQADLYSDQASRITELHGADLITILKDEILKSKTILEVGCGTGAFAKAYLKQFPKGIPGQTLILSDLSAGMLQKARETLNDKIANDEFQTKILFQEEDGTKLEGISESSVDLVVSLFGVFLIPDQEATFRAIRRVLKNNNGEGEKHEGTFANASWMFDTSDYLRNKGFGVSLQDAFQVPIDTINPGHHDDSSFMKWASRDSIKSMLFDKYKFQTINTYQAIHTNVWDFDNLWTMMSKNPMSNIQSAEEADVARAKKALVEFLTRDGGNNSVLNDPLLLSTASILTVARGFASS